MKEIDYLNRFQSYLDSGELDSTVLSGNEDVPHDRLLIYGGQDYQQRERIIEVTTQIQQLGQNLGGSSQDEYVRVQFQVTLPFKVEELAARDLSSLLLFLNKLIELPGWEFSELEDRIDYRYVLLTKQDGIDENLFNGIIGLILLITQLFTEIIEQVASGKRSFNNLIEEVIKIANKQVAP